MPELYGLSEMTLSIWLIFLLIGVIAGFLAGVFGIGGGFIIVPTLIWILQPDAAHIDAEIVRLALGTSLSTIIITGSLATWRHHQRNAVRWEYAFLLSIGLVLGCLCGAILATQLGAKTLTAFFACLAWFMALWLILPERKPKHLSTKDFHPGHRKVVLPTSGLFIGAFAALAGIGGGSFIVPLLRRFYPLTIQQAIGTASFCGVIVALVGMTSFALLGYLQLSAENSTTVTSSLPSARLGYIYLPASLLIALPAILSTNWGVRCAHFLPDHLLRRCFAAFLLVIGSYMMWPA